MAVYKSTHCYPFLNSVDIRVGQYGTPSNEGPAQYIKCKVDTSNKNVTGYKIRLLDADNNVLFPNGTTIVDGDTYFDGVVSPISELPSASEVGEEDPLTNSGINGTYLKIPVFQNYRFRKTNSFNSLYYKSAIFEADHLIVPSSYNNFYNLGFGGDESKGNLLSNWRVVSDGFIYEGSEKTIMMDSEPLMRGQYVLVVRAISGVDILRICEAQKITQDGEEKIKLSIIYSTEGEEVSDDPDAIIGEEDAVLVRKGKTAHDIRWSSADGKLKESSTFVFYNASEIDGDPVWKEEAAGVDLSQHGDIYKWEITLYQGKEELVETVVQPGDVGITFPYVKYDNAPVSDFDIIQTTGTVLGTSTKRIQIGSTQPFILGETEKEVINASAALPNWNDGTVLLQTRYIDLLTVPSGTNPPNIFDGTRLYVKTYDATYGHVYPTAGNIENAAIQTATHAQFFKHSNDPSQILDTDIVELGSALNLPFHWWIMEAAADGSYIMDTESFGEDTEQNYEDWKLEKINTRVIGISEEENFSDLIDDEVGFPPSLVSSFLDGSKILLTGQGRKEGNTFTLLSERNGVYVIYKVQAHDNTASGAMKTYWLVKRAASYTTWGNFIGRILYVSNYAYRNGSNNVIVSGQNIECLANAGGTIWNPLDNGGGDSPLLFTPEIPILLFENMIGYSFDLLFSDPDFVIGRDTPPSKVDDEIPKVGMHIYNDEKNEIYYVRGESQWELITDETLPSGGESIYIKNGLRCGKRAWKVDDDGLHENWEPYTAEILRNTTKHTYISPFISVTRGMKIKLSGGHEVPRGPIAYSFDLMAMVAPRRTTTEIDSVTVSLGMTIFVPTEKKVYTPNPNAHVGGYISTSITIDDGKIVYIRKGLKYGGESYLIKTVNGEYTTEKTQVSWISIKDVNNPFYCVTHDTLGESLSSEESSAERTPWKYEIRSNFKASDVNPFYLYNNPYLILKRNGIEYSDLDNLTISEELFSLLEGSNEYQQFTTSNERIFIVGYYGDENDSPENKIILSGEYVGTEDLEWESYRWMLYNSKYELIQDTGDKYNKKMQTIFYGISDGKEYYVILNVKDTKQNSLYYILKIRGKEGDACTVAGDDNVTYQFTAKYNQDMGAINLTAMNLNKIESFTILRREYDVLFNKAEDEYQEFMGEWMPVCIDKAPKEDGTFDFWDFNIGNHKRYQYVMFPKYKDGQAPLNYDNWFMQLMSNAFVYIDPQDSKNNIIYKAWYDDEFGNVTPETSNIKGASLQTCWDWWNIVELIPQDGDEYVPFEKKKYKVNSDQIWSFKYSLETGGQTQNIARSEIQNLGQFPKIGYGKQNYISGEVSALLGSEIFPHNGGYIERTRKSRVAPMTSNEKEKTLQQWRKMANSKNPKLLRDIKGQCWIVQIMSNSNTPKNFYLNQPDTISFQWKQIEACDGVSITLENNNQITAEIENKEELWRSVFSKL